MSDNNPTHLILKKSTGEAVIHLVNEDVEPDDEKVRVETTSGKTAIRIFNPPKKVPKIIRLCNKTMKNILEILRKDPNYKEAHNELPKILDKNYNADAKVPSFDIDEKNDKAPEYCLYHAYSVEYQEQDHRPNLLCNEDCFSHCMPEAKYTFTPFEEDLMENTNKQFDYIIRNDAVLPIECPSLFKITFKPKQA